MYLSKVQGSQGAKRARRICNTLSELRTQLAPQFAKSIVRVTGSASKQDNAAQRPQGYTVIEVLIVLAISGVIFVSGVVMFSGQSNSTAFEQSMQDTNSEIATRIRGVGSSQFFNTEGYTCIVSGNPARAILTPSGGGTGQQDCLVVGTAVEVPTGASNLYFYEVLGNRQVYGPGNNPLGPSTSLAEANPTPAVAEGTDLTFSFKLASDVKIISSNIEAIDGSSLASNLVSFYIDFSGEAPTTGSGVQTSVAKAYNYESAGHDTSGVKNCIEGTGCQAPTDSKVWRICFESPSGNRRAQIDITSQPTGVTTELKFINCT